MRLVGGYLRGRRLAAPATDAIRPTSDKLRETLFNILAHGVPDFEIEGAKVLDLFAGTGALGLEAISRGAAACVFVEDDAAARALIRRNIEDLGLTGRTRLFRRDATTLGQCNRRDIADLVFLDPPYGKGLAGPALASAVAGGWLADSAVVVIEERAGPQPSLPAGFDQLDQRSHGDSQLLFGRWSKASSQN